MSQIFIELQKRCEDMTMSRSQSESNVLNDGHLDFIISTSSFLSSKKLRYEIRSHGMRKTYYDPLSWIDELEGWDAFLD